MITMTSDKIEELKLKFQAIYEALQKIEELKENTKAYTAHIRESIKTIADENDYKQKSIKEALKVYIKSIEDPEEANESDELFAMFKEYNLLNLEAKE